MFMNLLRQNKNKITENKIPKESSLQIKKKIYIYTEKNNYSLSYCSIEINYYVFYVFYVK